MSSTKPPTLTEIWNQKAAAQGYPSLSHEDLLVSAGLEWVSSVDVGDYQGDMITHVRKGRVDGIVVIGYGSCSSCDMVQGLNEELRYAVSERHKDDSETAIPEEMGDFEAYRDQIAASVLWPSDTQTLAQRVAEHRKAVPYWSCEDDTSAEVDKLVLKIQAQLEAQD